MMVSLSYKGVLGLSLGSYQLGFFLAWLRVAGTQKTCVFLKFNMLQNSVNLI